MMQQKSTAAHSPCLLWTSTRDQNLCDQSAGRRLTDVLQGARRRTTLKKNDNQPIVNIKHPTTKVRVVNTTNEGELYARQKKICCARWSWKLSDLSQILISSDHLQNKIRTTWLNKKRRNQRLNKNTEKSIQTSSLQKLETITCFLSSSKTKHTAPCLLSRWIQYSKRGRSWYLRFWCFWHVFPRTHHHMSQLSFLNSFIY